MEKRGWLSMVVVLILWACVAWTQNAELVSYKVK